MQGEVRRVRVSPAMVVAIVALIIALGQTAFAGPIAQFARLVNGDKLIGKRSLSGNRLRNHTLTGAQINLAQLGTVPMASFAARSANATHASGADNASHATSADSATSASNAAHAISAGDATTLQGNPPSALMPTVFSAEPSGSVEVSSGATVASKLLPAGKYVLLGKVVVVSANTSHVDARCSLGGENAVGTIDFAESTALNEAGSEAFVTVVLMHSLTVSGAETIRLTCTAPFSGQAFAQFAAFDAYRLGGIQ